VILTVSSPSERERLQAPGDFVIRRHFESRV